MLLDLPNEIIQRCFEACLWHQYDHDTARFKPSESGRANVLSFGLTCRKALNLAEPFLRRTFLLRSTQDVRKLSQSLLQADKSHLKDDVRRLALVPRHNDFSTEYCTISSLLPQLPNLEDLFIEFPYRYDGEPNPAGTTKASWAEFQEQLASHDVDRFGLGGRSIPQWSHRLTTCHINCQANQGQPNHINDLQSIVFAPRLQNLTLVSAILDGFTLRGKQISPPQHVSSIRSLQLESCSLTVLGISQLLSVPSALKSFAYFPHRSAVDRDSSCMGSLGILSKTLTSLAIYQNQSLTSLKLQLDGLEYLAEYEASTPPADQISFSRLTYLENLTFILSPYDRRLTTVCLTSVLVRLPLAIQHLSLEHKKPDALEFPWLTNFCYALLPDRLYPPQNPADPLRLPVSASIWLPGLTNVTLTLTPAHSMFENPLPPHISAHLSATIGEIGHLYRHRYQPRTHPVHLTVIRRTENREAEPPFFWDEPQPEDILVYDNMLAKDMWAETTDRETKFIETERKRSEEMQKRNEEILAQQNAAHQAAVQAQLAAQAQAQKALLQPQAQAQPQTPVADEGMELPSDEATPMVDVVAQAQVFASQAEGSVGVVSPAVVVDVAPEDFGMVLGQTNSA